MTKRIFPKGIADDLKALVDTPVADISRLAEVLAGLPTKLFPDEDLAEAIRKCDFIASERSEALARAISGVHYVLASASGDVEDTSADLISSVERWTPSAFESLEARTEFERKLVLITGIQSLACSYKAWTLMGEHERLFLTGRVITDVRPVFGNDLSDPLPALLVYHSLRISYQHAGDSSEFFVGMDSNDLLALRDSIDRALKKAEALKKAFSNVSGALLDANRAEEPGHDE